MLQREIKKLLSIVLFVSLFLVLMAFFSGCATAPAPNAATELALADAIGECHASRAKVETARINKITDPRDLLLDRAIAGLSAAAGNNIDPCRIITNNDLQKTAMEENTKQIVAGVDAGKSAAGSIVTGLLGWKALDVLPDLFGSAGGTYNLTSKGDMALSDSLKTSSMGDVLGQNQFGGILSNPVDNTAEPFVFGVPQ